MLDYKTSWVLIILIVIVTIILRAVN